MPPDSITQKGKAVMESGMYEANPSRTHYRMYDADDILHLCYDPKRLDIRNKPRMTVQALRAIQTIETLQDCAIEPLGENPATYYLPWRIMPPDTKMTEQGGISNIQRQPLDLKI